MKNLSFRLIAVAAAAVILLCTVFTGCSKKDDSGNMDTSKKVAGITSPLPTESEHGEHYNENMALFGDNLNNMYTYECVYYYYKTLDKTKAYQSTVSMKTKLYYAIQKDYYLTEDEQKKIYTNAEQYLKMQYDDLNLQDAYTADLVSKELFGITFDQYKKIRLCESLIEKCSSDLNDQKIQDSSINENDVKKLYDADKEAYDFVVLRYISYKLRTGDAAYNQTKTAAAEKLCKKLNSVEDMLEIIGGESDKQSAGDSNGQITVYMNDSDNMFYEFIHEQGTTVGGKAVIFDTSNAYVAMSEGYFTWDSDVVKNAVKIKYVQNAVESEMTKNALQYNEPEDWFKMSGLEEIKAAKNSDNYINIIQKLKIAGKANTLCLTVQNPGDTTTCKFYVFEKENGTWKETFKTSGYVGRSGVEDTKNRVEGNGTSPAGVYSFGMLFGIKDDPGGLKESYKKVDDDDYWDGDNNSDTYNQYVKGSEKPSSWNPGASEHLIDYKYSYNYSVMVNYNVDPTIKGKGSAIFLHCTYPGSLYSAGCIAIPESKMLRTLRMIDDNAYIVIVRNAEDLLSYC